LTVVQYKDKLPEEQMLMSAGHPCSLIKTWTP